MEVNNKNTLHSQMKYVVWGCQATLLAIVIFRAIIGDYQTTLVLGSVMLLLTPLFFIIEKKLYSLASNFFCLTCLALSLIYMWTYEGARDEVSYVLPALAAFSLMTGTRLVTIFIIAFTFINILLIGYLTDIGLRESTISRNSLSTSILIVILMSFSIFIIWKILSHLKKAVNQLEHTLNTQHAILDNLGDALIITDGRGKIMQCSESAERMFMFDNEQLIDKSIFTLVPSLSSYYAQAKSTAINPKSTITHNAFEAHTANGGCFDVRLALTQTNVNNHISYIALISDISDEIEFQNQLRKATQEADSANQAKSEFLANMSHAIRTPMNGVLVSLQLLKEQSLPESAQEIIDTATLSSNHLVTVINDILDFSKIEAGKLFIDQIPFNIATLCESVIADLFLQAKEKGNQISLDIDPDFQDGWIGDPVRVKQVLINLVSNGVMFTEHGQVTISLTTNERQQLTVTVQDNGIGMTEDEVSILFDRFEQADNAINRKLGSTGLGMAITKHLVEMMDGEIKVTSAPSQGTCFTVLLPLPHKAGYQTFERTTPTSRKPDLKGVKVLLAEDNQISQKVFEKIMVATKAELTIAQDGREAVDMALSQLPDLIFMDIKMPNMDGISACKLIKRQHPKIPIIALTAYVMADDIKQYRASGFDAHVAKPIDMSELYQVINDVLSTKAN